MFEKTIEMLIKIFTVIALIFLLVTSPIWILPYLLYKKFKK